MPTGTPSPRTANRRRARGAKEGNDPQSRITAAMLELVSKQGYEASTVSDVISLIGMSRKTFYEHFEDRRGCFMWICEQVGSQWLEEAEQAISSPPEGQTQTVALLTALFSRAIEQPGALRSVMLEAAVVRPGGPELRERAIAAWSAMLAQTLRKDTGADISAELAAAIFGGIVRTLHTRLPAGVKPRAPRRRQLTDLVPQLAEWAASYTDHPPPARPLRDDLANASSPLLFGGRAPGTLALSSRSDGRRGLPRGENPISRSFVVHSQRERILDAVANLAAAKGYADLTIPEIVQEAAVSVQAFYEHFSGKEDAFLVAYEVGHRRALVAFERAFDSQEDWPNATRAGLQALFGFFAAEPAFAHCALVDAPSASERAAALLEQGVSGYAPMFKLGFKEAGTGQKPAPISAEAVTATLHELCFAHVASERTRELADLVPEAAFIALAPFIGGQAAARIAAGDDHAASTNGSTAAKKKRTAAASRRRKRQ